MSLTHYIYFLLLCCWFNCHGLSEVPDTVCDTKAVLSNPKNETCPGCVNEEKDYDKQQIGDMIDKALHELTETKNVKYSRGTIVKVKSGVVAGIMYFIHFQATKSDCKEKECPIAECYTSVVHKRWLNETNVICIECE
ncbi:uncharacterized protein LOC113226559 [Hyposmocoma kahamanoa]|uniref:uncharacterized protein LOC113226559 n=1 Tax=Hyposmocoma kahamanoa TaxID=1477025 RepID=UPI000E6D9099|nr:uncharacterized protein LOC113226559 [Hyposmocoma kahamanoa]